MAKRNGGDGHDGPIRGRLPENYGDPESAPLKQMKKGNSVSESKQNAASCPKPKANQSEGRAGRTHLGSEVIGCKKAPFNRERASAT